MDTPSSLPVPLRYGLSIGACLLAMAITLPLRDKLDLANAVMLFLLAVFVVALRLGRGPAILAAFLSVALFDFFYVPPQLTFAVSDVYYLITFAVMLAVSLLTTGLVTNLQEEAERARRHEHQTRDLYELARNLTGAASLAQVEEAVATYLKPDSGKARLFLLNEGKQLDTSGCSELEKQLLNLAFNNKDAVSGEHDGAAPALYLPLAAPMCTRGVMLVQPAGAARSREHLLTMASLVAIAIERLHYVDVAQQTQLQMSAEKLRSSVLSALSHDLRTPLTSLVGQADTLAESSLMPEVLRDSARTLRDQSRAMNNLLTNLLDMARLQAGKVTLRREWQLFEDVISAGLQLLRPYLGNRPVSVELAPNLPLVEFDAVLLERVLCNLVENAAKYSHEDQRIEIRAFVEQQEACIAVCDRGTGFPEGKIEHLFDLFERGEAESAKPGVGLGLAICKAIMEAHGGRIDAANRPGGGACVILRLPLGNPPAFEDEAEHD
ncbi:two-component system, OmpR family, sensor histidine kinase KdpD [Formivibrio citricus]|uniref:histidine kinase n=1 Tax=Formivibrio citricus TaxID=83765 RepID=A0A1I4V5S0_9NEIS|nr:DUF4118 domain-containing protein [Formivibrio citricus]SFM96508.1 two-component system, OmpR family, sensor histidine kinase KdpD [Formivibrio citricus]